METITESPFSDGFGISMGCTVSKCGLNMTENRSCYVVVFVFISRKRLKVGQAHANLKRYYCTPSSDDINCVGIVYT